MTIYHERSGVWPDPMPTKKLWLPIAVIGALVTVSNSDKQFFSPALTFNLELNKVCNYHMCGSVSKLHFYTQLYGLRCTPSRSVKECSRDTPQCFWLAVWPFVIRYGWSQGEHALRHNGTLRSRSSYERWCLWRCSDSLVYAGIAAVKRAAS